MFDDFTLADAHTNANNCRNLSFQIGDKETEIFMYIIVYWEYICRFIEICQKIFNPRAEKKILRFPVGSKGLQQERINTKIESTRCKWNFFPNLCI